MMSQEEKESNKQRLEYLINLIKGGHSISNRERHELMTKFNIRDLSIYVNENNDEIKQISPDNNNDNQNQNQNQDNSNNNQSVNLTKPTTSTTTLAELLENINFNHNDSNDNVPEQVNDDDSGVGGGGCDGEQQHQDDTKENQNHIIDSEKTKSTKEVETDSLPKKEKHDYLCDNCKICDIYEKGQGENSDCLNCKCSLIYHIDNYEDEVEDIDDFDDSSFSEDTI
ncbi:hypothetical protein CYY_002940 [Polysphondylium violaceum]|uniref:Uncharacterized protein n=1 Tax=Polysphondylium violaceum TaxID=133409 RepID=A0A8J4PXD7_9MYCE|nr:hypothetical protein CYY_002940 [Polysphondylium violaceum]